MPSVEGIWYNRGITALFILAYLAIAINFLRFLVTWVALHRLLRRLSWHPLLMGYALPKKDNDPALGKLRLDLSSPIPTFTTLTKSVEQARLLCRRIQQANSTIGSKLDPGKIRVAEGLLTDGFNFDAIRNWQGAFEARNKVRIKLIEFSKEVSAILQKQWITESLGERPTGTVTEPMNGKQTESPPIEPGKSFPDSTMLKTKTLTGISQSDTTEKPVNIKNMDQEIFGQAERFLISRLIDFLQYVLGHMQNLVVFVTAGILLMLGAVLSYPFQPMSPLLIFNWVTIVIVVTVTMLIFVQMNRNATLSLLSGTNPGELNWNSQFILQVLIHGLIPLLAITGAQFSDSLQEMISWLGITSHGT